MATVLWGHGSRDRGEEKTFVPDGTTIKWYSDLDKNLLTLNGFAALSQGTFGTPTETAGPGSGTTVEIINYAVFADLEKKDIVTHLNNDAHDLQFVGIEVADGHLCNDVDGCRANGSHICDGVFGVVKGPELVLMVCRGLPDSFEETETFGGDANDPVHTLNQDMREIIDPLMDQVKTNPEEAERRYDSWSHDSKLMAWTYLDVDGWEKVRAAAQAGRDGGIPAIFANLAEAQTNDFAKEFVTVPRYAEGLVAGAKADPERFFEMLDSNPGALSTEVGRLPGIIQARQEMQDARAAKFAADTWSPDDAALNAVVQKNASNVKAIPDKGNGPIVAGGVLALIGGGHEDRVIAYVERQQDLERGTINVVKGGAFTKGTITVSGISAKQDLVRQIIEQFSDKKVTFE